MTANKPLCGVGRPGTYTSTEPIATCQKDAGHVFHADERHRHWRDETCDALRAENERLRSALQERIAEGHSPGCKVSVEEVERLRAAALAVVDSADTETWNWLLTNGGMAPGTGYMNWTVKLGPFWELAQLLGRDKGPQP